jgi:branched-chain amino acid transport system permease protein
MERLFFFVAVGLLAILGLFIEQSYLLHILILCFIWSMVVACWDLVMGYAGIFNFAQLVFFAVGAYASAMASIHLGVPSVAALAIGGLVAGLAGLLIGLPCLRLRGEYIALFTFAVHLALPPLILQGRPLGTGGSTGLMGIPPLRFGDYVLHSIHKLPWYYFALILASVAIYVVYMVILRGRWGRAFVAMRDSEDFAKCLGVNDYKYKLIVFTISAAITGVAGAMYAHYVGVVTPKILGTEFFLMVMVMLSIGGLGRFPGVVVGAFAITIGNELLRMVGQYRLMLLGLAVVLTVLFLPNGIAELYDRYDRFKLKRRASLSPGRIESE